MNKAEQDALFGRLFTAHRQPIYGYLCNLLGDLMRAEELVQDVFVRAYQALPRLAPDANHRAWLYRIATNAARDHFRRQRLRQWLPLFGADDGHGEEPPDDSSLLESQMPDHEDTLMVRMALQKLPPHYRAPLVLYSVDGLSTAEIAEVLGIGQSAVKMRLARARGMFQQAYEAEGYEEERGAARRDCGVSRSIGR